MYSSSPDPNLIHPDYSSIPKYATQYICNVKTLPTKVIGAICPDIQNANFIKIMKNAPNYRHIEKIH